MTRSSARPARPGLARSSFAALALFAFSTGGGPERMTLFSRLHGNVIRRVAGQAMGFGDFGAGAGTELGHILRQVVGDRSGTLTCHSPDYIAMQPAKKGHAFWSAEVTKMIKVYGSCRSRGSRGVRGGEALRSYAREGISGDQ
jgi:hypothetical protein